jgi:microcystin-dependent protein
MAQPYVGEIRMFGGNFAPAGWMFCEGQLLPISENETLFNLIGTTYGGDGQSTFALPDLRGRVPIHMGTGSDGINYVLAETGGVEEVTLTTNQLPTHNHAFLGSTSTGTQNSPVGFMPAASNLVSIYSASPTNNNLAPQALLPDGGNQPHSNFQPYLCVDFIISLFGIFPSQ